MTRALAALTAALTLTMCALGAMAMTPADAEPAAVAVPHHVTLAAAGDLAPPGFWCASRRPHAADTLAFSGWIDMDAGVISAACAANHVAGGTHFYYVTLWDQDGDGIIENIDVTPLGPWWT